jgi:hypothetical protein
MMKGVAEMTDESTVPRYSPECVRNITTLFRQHGVPVQAIEWTFGLTPEEQDQLMAGRDDVWLCKDSPEHRQRVDARVTWWDTALEQALAEFMRLKRADEGGDGGEHGAQNNGHAPGEGVGRVICLEG